MALEALATTGREVWGPAVADTLSAQSQGSISHFLVKSHEIVGIPANDDHYRRILRRGTSLLDLVPNTESDRVNRERLESEVNVWQRGNRGYKEFDLLVASDQPVIVTYRMSLSDIAFQDRSLAWVTQKDVTPWAEERRRLERDATHDSVTDLINKRGYDILLENVLANLRRSPRRGDVSGQVYAWWLDLDRFKQINDKYGHLEGDEVIKQVAKRLHEQTRSQDYLARIQGDEYAGIIRGMENQHEAAQTALRLHEAVTSKPYKVRNLGEIEEISLGASLGMVRVLPTMQSEDVLREIDANTYMAKDRGRNRVFLDGQHIVNIGRT